LGSRFWKLVVLAATLVTLGPLYGVRFVRPGAYPAAAFGSRGDRVAEVGQAPTVVGEQVIVANALEVIGAEIAEGHTVTEHVTRRDEQAGRDGDDRLLVAAAAGTARRSRCPVGGWQRGQRPRWRGAWETTAQLGQPSMTRVGTKPTLLLQQTKSCGVRV
jgi:hypothetical protein